MVRRSQVFQEVRERLVRMAIDHGAEYGSRREAISSISEKIGCAPETLRRWLGSSPPMRPAWDAANGERGLSPRGSMCHFASFWIFSPVFPRNRRECGLLSLVLETR